MAKKARPVHVSDFDTEVTLYEADMREYRENRENVYWRTPSIFRFPKKDKK